MAFKSKAEFKKVIDRLLSVLSSDEEVGRKLCDADITQRFEVKDLGLVVNVAPNPDGRGGSYLRWDWSDDVDWQPEVELLLDSDVLNRYWQGVENVPIALARRRIEARGDIRKALATIPLTKLIVPAYRKLVEKEFPHLGL